MSRVALQLSDLTAASPARSSGLCSWQSYPRESRRNLRFPLIPSAGTAASPIGTSDQGNAGHGTTRKAQPGTNRPALEARWSC
eukprot:142743-Alexandrium_andersonii.AAC.1